MIEKAIYELIDSLGDTYAMRAKQNASTPFIVFQNIGADRWRSVKGPSGMAQANIQIDSYDDSYYGAKELGEQIKTALDGYRGTVSYGSNSPQDTLRIAAISLQDETDLFDQTSEPFLYRSKHTYLVTYEY